MKAAIYCRISSDKTGEAAGVTRQLDDCRALAAQLGWTVIEPPYIDNDMSASSGKARPFYRQMVEAIEAGEVNAIIVWAPDRLYRKLQDLEPLIELMERKGTAFKAVRGGDFDPSTPLGRMIARILASVATGEVEVKADRWKRSIRQRREQGQAPGWGPRLFGYDRDGEIEPDEAKVIRWIAKSLIEGAALRRICDELNEAGVTSTKGNPWGYQSLTRLMKNARLAGHATLNGETVGVGEWQPILSDEVFQQVQATFAVRRTTEPRAPRISLLLGLVRCGVCEQRMQSGRRNGGRRIYRCRRQPGKTSCGRITMDAEALEEMVESYARTRLADPKVRENLARLAKTGGAGAAEIVGLEERLTELEAQLDEPGVPVATIMRAMDRTRERIEALHAAVAATPSETMLRGDWPADLARRAKLVRLAVAGVVIDPVTRKGSHVYDLERVTIEPT